MDVGQMTRGTIILLNGTTSAGKTTIGRALQETMDEPYLLSGPDHFQQAFPSSLITITDDPDVTTDGIVAVYGEDGLRDVRFGPLARRMFEGVQRVMTSLSDSGLNVIVDCVLTSRWQLEQTVAIFHSYPAYFVCVDVSMAVAEQREIQRGDRGPGNVRYWYDRVYRLNEVYDLRVDSEANDPKTCARMIREAVGTTQPVAFERLFREIGEAV